MASTNPKDPNDPKTPTVPVTAANLSKLFVAAVFIGAMQGALSNYTAIVDWTKLPNASTVHLVMTHMHTALTLGAIRGTILGFIVVAVMLLGGPLWAILGPFLALAASSIANFVGAVSRAMRAKTDDTSDSKKS